MRKIILIILVLVVIIGIFFYFQQLPNRKPVDEYFCNIDEDCAIKIIGCDKECVPCPCINYGCVDKDWDFGSDCDILEGVSCPPAPPWVTNCKCINSKCADCRGDECKIGPGS